MVLCTILFLNLSTCFFDVLYKGETSPAKSPPTKKRGYKLPEKTKALLDADTVNTKLWSEVTTALQDYPVSSSAWCGSHYLKSLLGAYFWCLCVTGGYGKKTLQLRACASVAFTDLKSL